ncbi:hypothetical protein A6A19_07005 [Actinobacillus delphinicola]|uniref:Cell division protein FtsL n=1 Tax=Actinobacillus delphinicola TaxID=51161 RepID=A0A448TUS3_9PAST|nr:cell division protein FtsL [Actinobacillus delphinicola]MDG6897731.1 hypothetical protein [Actinobacillus delphinicola]VEJ09613.1 cell division protein FtsL [Actinobacillus delphinicola]
MRKWFSFGLFNAIFSDLGKSNKSVLFLTLLLFITGLATVWITHGTRLMIMEKGKLTFQNQSLAHEAVNLTLEETTLSDKSRVEDIAQNYLHMQPVKHTQEVLLME